MWFRSPWLSFCLFVFRSFRFFLSIIKAHNGKSLSACRISDLIGAGGRRGVNQVSRIHRPQPTSPRRAQIRTHRTQTYTFCFRFSNSLDLQNFCPLTDHCRDLLLTLTPRPTCRSPSPSRPAAGAPPPPPQTPPSPGQCRPPGVWACGLYFVGCDLIGGCRDFGGPGG